MKRLLGLQPEKERFKQKEGGHDDDDGGGVVLHGRSVVFD